RRAEAEAAGHAGVAPLAEVRVPGGLLRLTLGRNREHALLERDLDLVALEAGQLGLDDDGVVVLLDIDRVAGGKAGAVGVTGAGRPPHAVEGTVDLVLEVLKRMAERASDRWKHVH